MTYQEAVIIPHQNVLYTQFILNGKYYFPATIRGVVTTLACCKTNMRIENIYDYHYVMRQLHEQIQKETQR